MLAWVAVIAVLAWWVGLEELAREHFSASLAVALCSYVDGGKEVCCTPFSQRSCLTNACLFLYIFFPFHSVSRYDLIHAMMLQ